MAISENLRLAIISILHKLLKFKYTFENIQTNVMNCENVHLGKFFPFHQMFIFLEPILHICINIFSQVTEYIYFSVYTKRSSLPRLSMVTWTQ